MYLNFQIRNFKETETTNEGNIRAGGNNLFILQENAKMSK